MSYRTVGVSVLLVGAVAASAGDLLPYHRKAKLRCGLSNCYDYEVRRTSPPAVGTTFNTLTLPLVPATAPALLPAAGASPTLLSASGNALTAEAASRVKYWQAVDRELRVDHCAISQVAVWIDEQGNWSVNLTATQHPFVGPDGQATPEARFLRNRFRVTLRAYGAAPVNENPALAPLGKPELFHLDVTPFWVDRDQILLHRASGSLKTTPPELRLLPLVDRMTVEFRYE